MWLLLSWGSAAPPAITVPSTVPSIIADFGDAPLPAAAIELVSPAQVVGVGESMHLSKGLEEARAWLARRLIEEQGFRAVAMEISWVDGREVERRLQACTDPNQPWQAPSFTDPLWVGVLPLLERMCDHNRAHPGDPVHFFGVDIQDFWNHRKILDADSPVLRDRCLGGNVDTGAELRAWAIENDFPIPSRRDIEACRGGLEAVRAVTPDQRLALLSALANLDKTLHSMIEKDHSAAYASREDAMAHVFWETWSALGKPKTVLLAHDGHIARTQERYTRLGAQIVREVPSYVAVSVSGHTVESRLGHRFRPDSRAEELHAEAKPRLWVTLPAGEWHQAMVFVDHAVR